jgi:hypothetical protein
MVDVELARVWCGVVESPVRQTKQQWSPNLERMPFESPRVLAGRPDTNRLSARIAKLYGRGTVVVLYGPLGPRCPVSTHASRSPQALSCKG